MYSIEQMQLMRHKCVVRKYTSCVHECHRIVSWGFHQTMPLYSKYSVATFLACFGTLFFINWCFSEYTFHMKGICDASNISVSFRGDQCTSN